MNSSTIHSLEHAARFLDVLEEDIGINRLGTPVCPGTSSAPSEGEMKQFVAAVSKMHVGDTGILPSWIDVELTARLASERQILMSKSADERTGDCEWS